MVPDIGCGSRTHGLLVYLYGPGRCEEHTDAHLVGSWDGFAPDPGRDTGLDPDPKVTLARLTAALDLRVKQAGDRAPAKHVWHCSVRTAPGDRRLDDEEWNAVAQRIVHATGIAPAGDSDGCRWIAVRHAEDHIHIVATLVRGDLRTPRLNYDCNRAQAERRRIEKETGLRPASRRHSDASAAARPRSDPSRRPAPHARSHPSRRPAGEGRTGRGMEVRTDALVATLAQAEQAGHDSEALLRQAIDMRQPDSADDVSDVLVRRLRRIAELPAHPGEGARRPQAATRQATTPNNRASERDTTPAAPLGTVQDPNRRSSRRRCRSARADSPSTPCRRR
ncbi:relaxase/mobilization nuclease domain-containing protein [Streptomyces sp. NPDC002308]